MSVQNADYEKGKTANPGTDLEVKLLTLFAVTALQYFENDNWKLSNENNKAGKFEDLVFESDRGDILLQSKHKDSSVRADDLMSTNYKNQFSLAKYILSYKTIIGFKDKLNLILCTSGNVVPKNLLVKKPVEDFQLIKDIFKNSEIYVINKSRCLDILALVPEFQNKLPNNQEYKEWKKLTIDVDDINSFCDIFLCVKIKNGNVDNDIKERLNFFKNNYIFSVSNYEYLIEHIRTWYNTKASKATYMTNAYIKSILYGEENRRLANKNDCSISFEEHYAFDPLVSILHIIPGDIHELYFYKIRQTISKFYEDQGNPFEMVYKEVLFLDMIDNFDIIVQIIDCFNMRKFKFLIISLLNATDDQIKNICSKIKAIVDSGEDKKVILVAKKNLFNDRKNIQTIVDKISIESLKINSKQQILQTTILFQGMSVKLEDLKGLEINEYIIKEVIEPKEYVLGKKLKDVVNYYVPRIILNHKNESFSEDTLIARSAKKIIVISDIPGSGKTTLLLKLANIWKKTNPSYWVVNLDSHILKRYLNQYSNTTTFSDFLCFQEEMNHKSGQQFAKSLRKYILIDGIDEIGAEDRKELLNFVTRSVDEVSRILIATRKYNFIVEELQSISNLEIFNLQPFSIDNQLDFVGKYFDASSNTDTIIQVLNQVNTTNFKIPLTPLFTKMLGEIYSDKVGDLNLLVHESFINSYLLFKLFLEKQRGVFIKKMGGITNSAKNSANIAFDKYIEELRYLGFTKSITNSMLELLEIDEDEKISKSILDIGILTDFNEFIHNLYKEYFATEYIWALIKKRRTRIIKIILEELFLNEEYTGICIFFNSLLEIKNSEKSSLVSDISKICGVLINEIKLTENKNIINLVLHRCQNVLKLILDKCTQCFDVINFKGQRGITAIHLSVLDLQILQYLIEKGADVHRRDENGKNICNFIILSCCNSNQNNFELESKEITLKSRLQIFGVTPHTYLTLFLQTEKDAIDILRYLRKYIRNLDLNVQDDNGFTLLYYAAFFNLPNVLIYLLEECNMDVNICNKHGHTCQHAAAQSNALSIIKYFRKRNIDLTLQDTDGNTLIHYAAFKNSLEVLNYLIEDCKMDAEVANKKGDLPQLFAAESNALDVIKYFKRKNLDFNIRDSEGQTLINRTAFANSLDTIIYLIEDLNMKIDVCDKSGYLPQHLAAEGNAVDVIKYFKRQNIDLNVRSFSGETLIHRGALTNSLDVLVYLMEECNISANISDKNGSFPVYYAARGNALEVLKYFKSRNIDFEVINNDGDTILHGAALKNALDVIIYLMEDCNQNVDIKNKYGRFPQHCAAEGNAIDVIRYFRNRNVNFEVQDNKGDTLIHRAALENSLEVLIFLIEECKTSIDICNNNGAPAQIHAAEGNAIDVIKYFRNRNVNFEVQDNKGDTLIHHAALKNSIDVVRYLMEDCNIGVDVFEKANYSPLHAAAQGNALDVIKYFRSRNIDFTVQDENGDTLLITAAFHNACDVFKYLLEHCKMSLDVRNKMGCTAQNRAAAGNAIDIIKYFKSHNIELDVTDDDGDTLIHKASFNNALDVVKYLIENCNLDPKMCNKLGKSPQYYAAVGNALDVIKYFKNINIDLNARDNNGNTLLYFSAFKNAHDVVKYLIEDCDVAIDGYNKCEDILQLAVVGNALDVLKYFRNTNVDLSVRDDTGDNLLHYAARTNSVDVFKYLIEECKIDFFPYNKYRQTPLFYAAMNNALNVVKYIRSLNNNNLLYIFNTDVEFVQRLGAAEDVTTSYVRNYFNFQDSCGNTILHIAAYKNSLDVLKYLIEDCCMRVDILNKYGSTLLHCAASNNSLDVFKYLIEKCDMNVNIPTNNGHSSYQIALDANSIDIVEYFIKQNDKFTNWLPRQQI